MFENVHLQRGSISSTVLPWEQIILYLAQGGINQALFYPLVYYANTHYNKNKNCDDVEW